MPVCDVGVVSSLFVVSGFVVLCGLAVVVGRVFVVFRGGSMVIGAFMWHEFSFFGQRSRAYRLVVTPG